jgi:hypothetical protein
MCQKRDIKTAKIWLHPDDGPSVIQWVMKLTEENAMLAFKMSSDPLPTSSNLALDTFVLILQTTYQ